MNAVIFIKSALQQFSDYKQLGDRAFAQLEEPDFYYRPSATSNNLAVIIRHLNGNMRSRWTNFLVEDGEKKWRQRDEEFTELFVSKTELLTLWEQGWSILFDAILALKDDDLNKTIFIRTRPLTVLEAIQRQLTHYAAHVGQIMYIGKMIKDQDWQSLSIAKGDSTAFNEQMKKKS